MVSICCISDTHNQHRRISPLPSADILVHAGDISSSGYKSEIQDFAIWCDWLLENEKFKEIVLIAGNHDFYFEDHPEEAAQLFQSIGVHYLKDSSITLEGFKFYGAPWQPRFHDWAFNVDRGPLIAAKWALIPDDTDILITHGPPLYIGDPSREGLSVGCFDLLQRIDQLPSLKLHVCGHLHEGNGTYKRSTAMDYLGDDAKIKELSYISDYTVINAAICRDSRNLPLHEPIVFNL